ncbi:LacI family DNA-binding transcriptional regulator [Specibacter cremeus]|uniref:LacI family DNA-binding transcriptional regulator n=1 Tax=Specibacter cremeus TaxID=1629051 RepID=UPI000F7A75A3|nr:LacI family DNA-binding transcriptional regulator [Specibacter cremeus]
MAAASEGQHRAPVMEDVARVAGVSHQTVSRVLNHNPNVSDRTREKVERAIAELGYRRNTAARSLVTRRSQTIGVLASEMSEYGPSSTLLAVQEAAREAGYFVSIAGIRDVSARTIQEALRRFTDQSVDGIVVQVPHDVIFETLRELSLDVPVVVIGAAGATGLSGVRVDQESGARQVVAHLIGLGHRTIGHVSGPRDWIDAKARIEGWRGALADAGLSDGPLVEGDWSAGGGYRAGLELAANTDVTAVFAANDQMALGLLRAFAESGRRVPADISVAGFDDVPESGYYQPPLTTVRQGFEALGRRCIEVLLAELAEGSRGATVVVRPELVVRGTTAGLAGG